MESKLFCASNLDSLAKKAPPKKLKPFKVYSRRKLTIQPIYENIQPVLSKPKTTHL